jgi:methylenetetrahydrofolate reductase (NADPH)
LPPDPPRDAEYAPDQQEPVSTSEAPFVYAIDLVRFIRANYGDAFCIGVAGSCPSLSLAEPLISF